MFVVVFFLFKEHFMILKERKIQSKTWLSWNHFNLQGRYMIWTDAAFFFFGDFSRAQGGPCIIWLICFHIQRWSSYPTSLRCLVVLISFSTIKLLVVGPQIFLGIVFHNYLSKIRVTLETVLLDLIAPILKIIYFSKDMLRKLDGSDDQYGALWL